MSGHASLAMATAQFQRGEAAAAAELLGPVLAAEPDNVRALVLMTHAQLALKQPELAARDRPAGGADTRPSRPRRSARSAGRSPRWAGTTRRSQVARRAADLRAGERLPAQPAGLGAARRRPARPVEAEHAARAAVRLDPQEADFRITYAMVMKQLEKTDRARQALRDALALEPDNAVAQHELATLDVVHRNPFALGRLARGASGLAGALRADPRQQASKFMLDVALRRFLAYTDRAARGAGLRRLADDRGLGARRACAGRGRGAGAGGLRGLLRGSAWSRSLRAYLSKAW